MNTLRLSALLIAALSLAACDDNNTPKKESFAAHIDISEELPDSSGFASHLGLNAYTDMSMASQRAQELDAKLAAFLHNPSATTLEVSRQAWRSAYDAYLQTLLYAKLPLSDPPEWSKQNIDYQQTLITLDSWPIEGGYIDYVPGYPFSGIVNDLTLKLSEDNLLSQHRFSDPTYGSLGYHALEFMLWGHDGNRSARDFMPQENTAPVIDTLEPTTSDTITEGNLQAEVELDESISVDVQNHTRRRQYLQLVSEQLQKHLHRLQRRWEPSNGHYASLLTRSKPEYVLRGSLIAAQRLLSDELLELRLSGNSSEFSRTSAADVAAILQGLRNVFLPALEGEQITGLASTLSNDDIGLIDEWQKQLNLIQTSVEQWQQIGNLNTEARQNLRHQIIELLSLLHRTALAVDVKLPDAN